MTPRPFRRRSLLLLATALLTGCAKPPAPPDSPPPAPVTWEAATLAAPEQWTELVGVTQPLPGAVGRIAAPIDGRIDGLLVVRDADGKVVKQLQEGDVVSENDPVAYLDDRLARLNLEKAQAAADAARSGLNLANAQLASQQELQKKNPALVPEIQMKTAQAAAADAQSKLTVAEKDVDASKAQLAFYTLRAPIKGRLGRVQAMVGQTVTAGTEVAQIVNIDDQIDVLCFVSQRDAARLQVDQPANLGGFDKQQDMAWTEDVDGNVVYVSDKAEPETGCFAVKVRFHNQKPHLRGNAVQRIRVQTKPGEQQLSIVNTALIEDRDPPSVVIVEDVKTQKNADGKDEQVGTARRMQAIINVRDRELKIVGLRGLRDSDGNEYKGPLDSVLFVTSGAEGLEDGDAVRLKAKETD